MLENLLVTFSLHAVQSAGIDARWQKTAVQLCVIDRIEDLMVWICLLTLQPRFI